MLKRTSVALALAYALAASSACADPQIEVLAQFDWQPKIADFGGLSALEVDDSGSHFTALSDTGVLYKGILERDAYGILDGALLGEVRPLVFENGRRPATKHNRDTEGLALTNAGGFFASAEFNARLFHYAQGQEKPEISALPAPRKQTPANMGFEALAITKNGILIAIPEGSPNIRAPFEVYARAANGSWSVIYHLPRHGGYRPVGADFGPDGHLYILSRAFIGFGFLSRIDRLSFDGDAPSHYEQIYQSHLRQFDNLEGLSVWKAGENDLRLYAISDDNFSAAQTTEIVEFRLKE